MFNFANVYQQIAQHPQLQLWLNTLPQQLTDWQAKQHGDLDRWMRNLKKIPVGQPEVIDLKNAVAAHNHQPLAQGEQKKLKRCSKPFTLGVKVLTICTAFILIPNGDPIGNGIAYCHTSRH